MSDATLIFKPHTKALIDRRVERGMFALKEQVLTDCNYFVRVDQGILRDTAYVTAEGENITVTYPQEYAKRVYYTGHPSEKQNPNASLMWCKKAEDTFGDEWRQILEKAVNTGGG